MATCNMYPLTNYSFGVKDALEEKDKSIQERMMRYRANYLAEGMRTSVEGILIVHQNNHPHILLLQIANTFFKLPGGKCKPGEDPITCLKRKLNAKLGPEIGNAPVWEIGDMIGQWWRLNFDTVLYPYLPAHRMKPKECKKLYIVKLPQQCFFAVPRNYKLLAVPLYELYDNVQRYGVMISSIPHALSRYRFNPIQPTNPPEIKEN